MSDRTLRILEYSKITESLAEFAASPLAKEKCRDLKPLTDMTKIRRMQGETTDALRRIYKNGAVSFSGVRDIRGSFPRLKVGATLGIKELLDIASTLEAALRVKSYGRRESGDDERDCLDPMFKLIEPLTPLAGEIRRAFLDEENVADDASPGLKSIRRQIKTTGEKIRSHMSSMLSSQASKLQDNIITMRSGRYCLPVKAEYRSQFPGMIHDQSSTGATLFIEPMAIVKLNNDLAQLYGQEQEEIEHILEEFSEKTAEQQAFIEQDISILSAMDFIFARALLSRSYNGSEAIFNENGYINLKKARHPLLDKKKVVPIDVRLGHRADFEGRYRGSGQAEASEGEPEFSMLIVTGPNTGGKTVSLKTVGLLTLMGQSGLHIPAAERSQLSVFDEVYADIGDEQSIEQSLSTFSAHMTNIVEILKNADDRSLVLLDELCAGTDPTEGASLAISILKNLLRWGIPTMATTHYSELKVFAMDTEDVSNASCEFDIQTLSPTYRLLIGLPGKSNAFAISRKLGLPEEIIEDAKGDIDQDKQSLEDLLADLETNRAAIEKEREEISLYREEIDRLRKKLESRSESMERQKQRILDEAREKARNILQDAKDHADHTIRTVNKLSQSGGIDMKALERERSKAREKLDQSMPGAKKGQDSSSRGGSAEAEFGPGESVLVKSLNIKGIVIGKPDKKGEIEVQMGILKSRFPAGDLAPVNDEEERGGAKGGRERRAGYMKGAGDIIMDKSSNAVTSINLIGMTVDQAMPELEKFLDDAYLANIPEVNIIHGRGTGALKSAVHRKLKGTKYVKKFRLGSFGEGDTGVTIAEIG